MDKKRVLSFGLAFLLILQIFTVPFATPASAAARKELKKVNGKIYYYVNGTKIKNAWRNVEVYRYVKGKPHVEVYRYYFGKDGAAYKMVKGKVVKIGKNRYYFQKNGKMLKGQKVARIKGKIWTLNKNGQMLKNISAYAKEGKSFDAFIKKAGKPKKSTIIPFSCYGPGKDGVYTYGNFKVYTYEENGVRKIMGWA